MRDQEPTGDLLQIEVHSVANWSSHELIRRTGSVFDAHPIFVPDLIGRGDPLRAPLVGSMAEHLVTVIDDFISTGEEIDFERREGSDVADCFGTIKASPAQCGRADIPAIERGIYPNVLDLNLSQDWFRPRETRADRVAEVAEAFVEWCECSVAFYGKVSLTDFRFQYLEQFDRAVTSGDIPVFMPDPNRPFGRDSLWVDDVCWLNFFGPSYIARWGREQIDGLGVRQEWLGNGGVIVWATESPFVFDRAAARIDSYPWKWPFYERLGRNTFRHEGFQPGERGEHVPDYAEHAASLSVVPDP